MKKNANKVRVFYATGFSYRPASFGGKISQLLRKQTNDVQSSFAKDLSKTN